MAHEQSEFLTRLTTLIETISVAQKPPNAIWWGQVRTDEK